MDGIISIPLLMPLTASQMPDRSSQTGRVRQVQGIYQDCDAVKYAYIVFAIIPPIIIFFFLQKYIMGGLSIGGVKE